MIPSNPPSKLIMKGISVISVSANDVQSVKLSLRFEYLLKSFHALEKTSKLTCNRLNSFGYPLSFPRMKFPTVCAKSVLPVLLRVKVTASSKM